MRVPFLIERLLEKIGNPFRSLPLNVVTATLCCGALFSLAVLAVVDGVNTSACQNKYGKEWEYNMDIDKCQDGKGQTKKVPSTNVEVKVEKKK